MRLEKVPRPGGKGGRRWRVTLGDLQRWTAAYGLPLPAPLAVSSNSRFDCEERASYTQAQISAAPTSNE